MALITTRDQLRTRVNQLRRALKGVRPNSQDVVTLSNGLTTTRWMRDEVKRAHRYAQKNRSELRSELYPDWDRMTKAEQGAAMSDKDIADLAPVEEYYRPSGLDDLTRERYLNDYVYMSQYLDVWAQWNMGTAGYDEVVRIVRELVRSYPGELRRILEADYDEATIEYLYPQFGASRVSAYREPFVSRSNSVVRFWNRMWGEVSGSASSADGWIEEEMVAGLGTDS